MGGVHRKDRGPGRPGGEKKTQDPIQKINKGKKAGGVAQGVEALNSNPSITINK
jgi:hypothetical protein